MPWPLSGPVNPYSQFVSPGVMVQTPKQGETVAPVSAFAPSDLSGLAGWWKADAITALNDGDPVGTWPDSSGNGRDATQGTAGFKPTYRTNVVNGKPVVRYDGVDDRLRTTNFGLVQPYTILAVCAPTTIHAAANNALLDGFTVDTALLYINGVGNVWQLYAGAALVDGAPSLNPTLVSAIVNGASSRLAINQGPPATGNAGATNPGGITIGSDANGSKAFAVDVAEVILYSRALSTSERQQVESYLMTKYAIV